MSAMAAQVVLGAGLANCPQCSICVTRATSSLSHSNPSKLQLRAFGTRTNVRLENASSVVVSAKKGWFDDPFDYGADDEEDTMGELMSQGPQGAEDPRPARDPDSESGYLDFPAGFMPEVASLGILIRNDVRRCLCMISGGVYENLLFFPVIQLLKNRYPGVRIDVMATPRGKQAYEMNKNVRKAWVHPVDDQFLRPVDFTETVGKIKGEYYDLLVSTKLAGLGQSIFFWLASVRNKVSYTYPDVNAAGAAKFLDIAIKAPQLELAESGFNMYAEMIEELSQMGKNVPKTEVPPLEVGIGSKVKAYVEAKYREAGVREGEFLVFHGIECDSSASMTSKGDKDCLLPLSMWAEIAKSTSDKVVFVIPNEKWRRKVKEICGENAHIVFITTPGQLGALINASKGVVTTNTAALQIAIALKKSTVALFASQEKANLFIPDYAKDACAMVASKTGKLCGLDLKAATMAVSTIAKEALVAA
ncbi:photosynthetic NDH subunit of subcomplex B 1, chloroplastic [Physcomitrium patens]|uniref:Uncharacterized protein n=1 Tax=Physcomitrium patens TaxID=3218 RepID=A9SCR2_PHYPA|nr:photosynthetic NDH subunit of subcomplex B 1, chloroplastic-like [Physcomitrium patens]PNR39850.1 hypothetical protein PHYPA_020130 [Physcomitrium patens]|eukprot:XP_024397073.1 photosynthetic NDH subunit of subcomplex B 1, chloroplastic-like [Physcomitrella patens]